MSEIAKRWLRKADGAKFEVTQQPHDVEGTQYVGIQSVECNDGIITLESLHRYFEIDAFADMVEMLNGGGMFGSSVPQAVLDHREAEARHHEAEAAAWRSGLRDLTSPEIARLEAGAERADLGEVEEPAAVDIGKVARDAFTTKYPYLTPWEFLREEDRDAWREVASSVSSSLLREPKEVGR